MKKIRVVVAPGLLLASIATAFGAGASQEFTKRSSVKITGDGTVTVYGAGKAVQNFTLPEGEEYSIETPSGRIHIGRMTKEEVEKAQAEVPGSCHRQDSWCRTKGNHDESVAILTLEVKGRYYRVTIDLGSETVKSVEEEFRGRKVQIT